MFLLNLLFYHAHLLGRKRSTPWDDTWLGAFYVVSGIIGIWLLLAIYFIETHWGYYVQGACRPLLYIVSPLLILVFLAFYYKCSEKRIMELWWKRTLKYSILQIPSYAVLFLYWLVPFLLLVWIKQACI